MKKEKPHLSPTMATISEVECKLEETDSVPMDAVNIEVYNLRLYEDDNRDYLIKMSFYNREILTEIIKPVYKKDIGSNRPIATGNITYSPANYEEMCVFADYPLIVTIHPYHPINASTLDETLQSEVFLQPTIEEEESCCNIDILPLFIDQNEMKIQQTLEPVRKPTILEAKSWNTLPQIDIQISVVRDPLNQVHQEVLEQANVMKVTLIGVYNMLQPYDPEFTYAVATYMPINREAVDPVTEKDIEMNANIVTFNDGKQMRRKFNFSNFQQKWGTSVTSGGLFSKCDDKMNFNIDNLQNQGDIEIEQYLKPNQYFNTVLWKSFHRHFILGDTATWLAEHICKYKWPMELHLYSENGGYSFMAFLDLFLLLYPGETTVNLVVPLQWINSAEMINNCGCELLLTPENGPLIGSETNNSRKMGSIKPPELASAVSDADVVKHTGFDESPAFVLVQVHLAKPLKKIVIPTPISQNEIDEMLTACEVKLDKHDVSKLSCTGRGQRERMWQQTIETAAESLRNVPFYGKMEYCSFNRQLSESRTRVELATSFCQDSAIYVNNNFVVGNFLTSDEAYEELVRMSHAHLMKETVKFMLKVDDVPAISPVLRAARHARQLQDLVHAKFLYMQVVTENTKDPNSWRELSTCFRDINKAYASICINQTIALYPRHPLSLLSRAATLFEEDPDGAEIFFVAILRLYPFWKTGWVIVSAYYSVREMHHFADEIMKHLKLTIANITPRPPDPDHPRTWERELGDWWDYIPLLPGQTLYYEAADLLLRLRAVSLAEVCVAKALPKDGETPQYIHLVALCCRLRGDYDDAICHLEAGIQKFGNISCLAALLAECRHQKKDCQSVFSELAKAGSGLAPYSTLLSLPGTEPQKIRAIVVELIRRCPSAYAWMALADDWLRRAATGEGGDAGSTDDQNAARNCAIACAVQALKIDRRAGRAWALLAKLCEPSLRRSYYNDMAITCGYEQQEHDRHSISQQSLCHYVGIALLECQCEMYLKI